MKKQYEYHGLFYYRVLGPLKKFIDSGDNIIGTDYDEEGAPFFFQGWTPRTDEFANFQHNFQREKFLNNRDKLVTAKPYSRQNERGVIILQISNDDSHVTVFEKAVHNIFDTDYKEALNELTDMLRKFYDTVTVADSCEYGLIDFSNDRGHHAMERVHEFSRV